METCKKCKFWGRGETAVIEGAKWGDCSELSKKGNEFANGYGYIGRSYFDRGIETHEDFGCILYQKKGEENGKTQKST